MKYRSLLLCLSILVMVFAGCSSSQQSAEELARLEAEHAKIAEQSRLAEEQSIAAQQTLAAAEQAKAAAEQALSVARQQAKSAQQAKAAEEAKAKADADHARAVEEAKAALQAQAKAEAEAKAAEEARAAAKKAKTDARQEARTQVVTLAVGTPINVITASEISTQTVKTGDVFTLLLSEDITDGGRVIARRGASVKGQVLESDPGGRIRGVAMLSLTLTGLTLAEGGEASIRTSEYSVEAKSSVGKDVAKTGIGAGIGAAIGAIAGGGKGAAIGAGIGGAAGAGSALVTRGDAAVVAPETPITFNLAAPLSVTLQQDRGGRR